MRNLKRALSLALASVMLLGMMVIGTSAASFSDADEVVNKEAVEITAGLGLFAGSDGKFNPKGNVTRAQMATVIVKMLYGSDVNADQFKGFDKFSDTVTFEGGWAEGYINWCANLGIVSGYGDGTFKPGNSVTTAEAVTMIINALGVDAGEGTWPLTVMAKAEEMKLFAKLAVKPGTNVALTRDDLAAIVLEGINYSPAGSNGYQVPGVDYIFSDYADALAAAATLTDANGNALTAADVDEVVGDDALSKTVFGMLTAKGIVVANQATDYAADFTSVQLEDGTIETFALETGVDMIGQYVTVYYKDAYTSELEPGQTYCMVSEGKTVVLSENITAGEANQNLQFKNAFGSRTVSATAATEQFANYAPAGTSATITNGTATYNFTAKTAPKGTYVIVDNEIVSYLAPAASTVTTVSKIVTTAGKETITLRVTGLAPLKNNVDEDQVAEYEGIAVDDVVSYTRTGNIYTLAKVNTIEGKASKTSVVKIDGVNQDVVTVDGTDYIISTGNLAGLDDVVGNINFNTTYKFYVNASGKCVGWEPISGTADLTNVVYVVDVYEVDTYDNTYGTTSYKVYAQGVDMEGKEVTYVVAIAQTDANDADSDNNTGLDILFDDSIAELNMTYTPNSTLSGFVPGFYTFEKSSITKAAALGIMIADDVATAYNKITAPLYQKVSVGTQDLTGKSTFISTNDGTAYLTAETKFLVFNGSQSTLSTAITVGSINHQLPAGSEVLLTRNTDGNNIVEVVIIAADPDSIVSGDWYYVADTSIAYSNANGDVYEVYNNKGEIVEITVNGTVTAGFKTYSVDAEGITTLGNIAEGAFARYNDVFETIYANELVTDSIDHYDLTNAIIVDIRDEDLMENSGIYAVETAADLMALKSIDDADITLDVYTDDENVVIIFVKEVVPFYIPDNGETMKYLGVDANDAAIKYFQKQDSTLTEVKVEVIAGEVYNPGDLMTYDAADNKFN